MENINVSNFDISISANNNGFIGNNISDKLNCRGTNDTLCDTFSNSAKLMENNKKDNDKQHDAININIYRYKFTCEFMLELFKFSKIHQYDHRKDFKEAWEIWTENNDELIEDEIRRLNNFGYNGDVLDKMFKSARYYFRKKSTEKKEPSKRRIYVGTQKDMLEAMDQHIKSNINSGNFKPSDGFDEFCKENVNLLKEEVNVLCRAGITNSEEIKEKIKKTYKNRYFISISKQ
jgi:hypothetical protein